VTDRIPDSSTENCTAALAHLAFCALVALAFMVRKLNHRYKHFLAMNIVVGSAMMAGGCGFYVNKIRLSILF